MALGFSASIAAFGGFFIPIILAATESLFGAPHAAMAFFGLFTLSCMLATWNWYYRKGAEVAC